MAIVGLLAESSEDVPVVWTPLLRVDGKETETQIGLRITPSGTLQREIRAVAAKSKHMSEKDKEKAAETWLLDSVCRAFHDSKEWDTPIYGPMVEKYRKFFPDLAPGLMRLDGKWTEELKRQYFRDEPAVMAQVWATYQAVSGEQIAANEAEEKSKETTSLVG